MELETPNHSSMYKEYDYLSIRITVVSFVDASLLSIHPASLKIYYNFFLADSRARKLEVTLQKRANFAEEN